MCSECDLASVHARACTTKYMQVRAIHSGCISIVETGNRCEFTLFVEQTMVTIATVNTEHSFWVE